MLRGVAQSMRDAPLDLCRRGSVLIDDAIQVQLSADTRGSNRISGISPQPLTTTVTLRDDAGAMVAIVDATQKGLWTILEKGTRPHDIAARPYRRNRALRIGGEGGDWRQGPVHVSGARGKQTFTHGAQVGVDQIVAELDNVLQVIIHGA